MRTCRVHYVGRRFFCGAVYRDGCDVRPPSAHAGALYGAELVPYLVPIFMLCGMLLFLWWVFRTTLPRREKATLFVWMLARSAMAGFAFCAAFLGGEVRPACALGGLLMFVSAVIFLSHGIAGKDTEEGMGEKLSWATYYPGVALLTIGISLLY